MAVVPLSNVTTTGPNTAQAGPRVMPAGAAMPVAQGGGQAGSGAQAPSGTSGSSQPTVQQAAVAVKQVTTQALLTLIQSLGKPLNGTSTAPTQAQPISSGSNLSVQVQVPATGGQPAQTLQTNLPLPQGSTPPLPGTPVSIGVDTMAGGKPQISVTVQGSAAPSPESLRADATRQASLAPLMADIAKLSGQTSTSKAVDAAIGRLMGFSINAEVTGNTLRQAVDGARGQAQPVGTPSGAGTSSGAVQTVSSGAQNAMSALIKALGLALPNASQAAEKPGGQPLPHSSTGQKQGSPGSLGLPTDARHPTKAPAIPLPADAPDMTDAAHLQTLKSKAEAALSRLNLLQARMQDSGSQTSRSDGPPAVRWDVPLMIGQEAALLGVAVEKDGGSATADQEGYLHWRFRFAFQSTRHGEVEGLVALQQNPDKERSVIDVAIWAKEPRMLALLEAARADLVAKLEALDIQTGSLTLAASEAAPRHEVSQAERNRHLVDVRS